MERLELDDSMVEAKRQEQLAANANAGGQYDDPQDDPTREGDICPGSPLKLYDDVLIFGRGYRVVAPGIGRDTFSVFGMGDFGWTLMAAKLDQVQDRAPADPTEAPMPVLAAPAPDPGLQQP